jgi:hypothetical protein
MSKSCLFIETSLSKNATTTLPCAAAAAAAVAVAVRHYAGGFQSTSKDALENRTGQLAARDRATQRRDWTSQWGAVRPKLAD